MQWTEKDYRKMDTAIKKGYELTTGGRFGLKLITITRKTTAAAFIMRWTAGLAGIRRPLRG